MLDHTSRYRPVIKCIQLWVRWFSNPSVFYFYIWLESCSVCIPYGSKITIQNWCLIVCVLVCLPLPRRHMHPFAHILGQTACYPHRVAHTIIMHHVMRDATYPFGFYIYIFRVISARHKTQSYPNPKPPSYSHVNTYIYLTHITNSLYIHIYICLSFFSCFITYAVYVHGDVCACIMHPLPQSDKRRPRWRTLFFYYI